MGECSDWMFECRRVFPKLDELAIDAEYKKMSKKTLGYVKGKVFQEEKIDPEALLLKGITKRKRNKKLSDDFTVYINDKLKKVKNPKLRKQVVQSIIIHELLHVEKKDLLTISKGYKRRKKKKIHVKDFEQEVFERFNQLRRLTGMPIIKSKKDLDLAISTVFRKVMK